MSRISGEMAEEFKRGAAGLEEVFDVDAGQVAALVMTGYKLFEQGRLEDARRIFEGLVVLNARDPFALGVLGAISQREEKDQEAVAWYSAALTLFEGDVASRVNRGEVLLQLGRFQEAAADFKAVIEADPEAKNPASNRARLLVAVTRAALKVATERGVEAVVQESNRLALDGQASPHV